MRLSIITFIIGITTLSTAYTLSDTPAGWDCCDSYAYWDSCCDECCFLHHAQPCNDDWGFFGGFDYLCWTVYSKDCDFAVDGVNTAGVGNRPAGKYHSFHPLWTHGLRAMAGFRWAYDGWDTRVIYTYLHNSTKSNATPSTSVSDVDPQFIMATMFPPASGLIRANSAVGNFGVNYDTLDLVFTRPFYVSCAHILRPYFGVRGAWIRQRIKTDYIGLDFTNAPGRFGRTAWKGAFEGAGILAGIEYDMHICDCVSLFANVGCSVLGGHHRDNTHIRQLVPNPNFNPDDEDSEKFLTVRDYVDVESTELSFLPGIQAATGFNWETRLCGYCLTFSFGYELTQWFFTPTVRRFEDNVDQAVSNSSSDGGLLLHGITFSGDIYF